MSQSSFPRPEHVAALRAKIEERIQHHSQPIELAERGLNHYKCQYRFGLRRGSDEDWVELPIHFEFAQRLENTGSDTELNRMVDRFLDRHFMASTDSQ